MNGFLHFYYHCCSETYVVSHSNQCKLSLTKIFVANIDLFKLIVLMKTIAKTIKPKTENGHKLMKTFAENRKLG